MKSALNVRIERKPGRAAQVVLDGSIDAHTFDRFKQALSGLTDEGIQWIVLDLRQLAYIGSVGVSFLINLRVERRKGGGEVILVGPQPSVYKIFKMLGLLEVLVISRTVEEAWSQIRERTQPSGAEGSGGVPLIE